jgi:steroid 5-alpha reductase family enzyme
MAEVLITNLAIIAFCLITLWAISIRIRDASIIDIFWGPGFGIIALTTFILTTSPGPSGLLLMAFTCLWSIRLGTHLAGRWLSHGRKEDARYIAMRKKAGPHFGARSLITVYGFQGILMWIVALPLQIGIAQSAQASFGLLTGIGCIVFTAGFTIEALADAQLRDFKSDPGNDGKIMQSGIWAWSRHPNYFGNACLWWGLFLIATQSPFGALTILSPILMTFLLLRVSGVALLERRMARTKPDYLIYRQSVNAFVPLPPSWKRHKEK